MDLSGATEDAPLDSKWSTALVNGNEFLMYSIAIQPRQTHRMGRCDELPDHYNAGAANGCQWGCTFLGYDDQLCFWRCLAKFLSPQTKTTKLASKVKKLVQEFYNVKQWLKQRRANTWKKWIADYAGVTLEDISKVEKEHELSFDIYELTPTLYRLRRGPDFPTKVNLACYRPPDVSRSAYHTGHLMLITDAELFAHAYTCRCGRIFETQKKLTRHQGQCKGGVRHQYAKVDDTHEPQFYDANCSKRLKARNGFGRYPAKITLDFETEQPKVNQQFGALTKVTVHQPLSCGLFAKFPDGTTREHVVVDTGGVPIDPVLLGQLPVASPSDQPDLCDLEDFDDDEMEAMLEFDQPQQPDPDADAEGREVRSCREL